MGLREDLGNFDRLPSDDDMIDLLTHLQSGDTAAFNQVTTLYSAMTSEADEVDSYGLLRCYNALHDKNPQDLGIGDDNFDLYETLQSLLNAVYSKFDLSRLHDVNRRRPSE